jgi:hypothetical protein
MSSAPAQKTQRSLAQAVRGSWFVALLFGVFAGALWIQLERMGNTLLRQGGALAPWIMAPLAEAREQLGWAIGSGALLCWMAYVGFVWRTERSNIRE